jgi:hypothetical protein
MRRARLAHVRDALADTATLTALQDALTCTQNDFTREAHAFLAAYRDFERQQQPDFQATYRAIGRILVDKSPDGAGSPNGADTVMIAINSLMQSVDMWIRLAS